MPFKNLFRDLFKKERKVIPLERNKEYEFNGRTVMFDLSGVDFAFHRFQIIVTDDKFTMVVPKEPPLKLVLISETARMDEDMEFEMENIIDADTTSFTLELDGTLFTEIRDKIFNLNDTREIFDIEQDGERLLRKLENYEMVKGKWEKTEKG